MYRLLNSDGYIERLTDGAHIPKDPANIDYQAYVQWCEDGNVANPIPAMIGENLYLAWKSERAVEVASITVEVDGLVFDGDEDSQSRMARAVSAADSLLETTEWTLADNTVTTVTIQQLKAACRLAGEEQTRIWNEGRPA